VKRLTSTQIRNAGIIAVDLDPEEYQKFKDNTFVALRKFSSSRKTKAVHKIIENNLLEPALFNGEAANYLVTPIYKETVLHRIAFNLYYFDDSLDRNGAVNYATRLQNIKAKIQKEKTYLSEKQLYNLEQLNNDKEEISEKLLHSLDYIKLIDGIYFGWLIMLSHSAVANESSGKAKIITVAADILASILKKMYMKVNPKIEPEVHQVIEAIAIYFIRIYFYGETAQYALNLLQKAFSEETLEVIKKSKVTRFQHFNELSVILKETQLLPLTTNTFDLQMQKMFGKYAYEYYIQTSLVDFIAFMANLAHPTQLFKDAYEVDDDSHLRLEELLLNEQKKITLFKGNV
jgi:hypothetical protein